MTFFANWAQQELELAVYRAGALVGRQTWVEEGSSFLPKQSGALTAGSLNVGISCGAVGNGNSRHAVEIRIFTSHGGRGNEGRVQVDGLNIGAAFNGGGVSGYVSDTPNAQEISMTLSGGLGEAEVGGTQMNIIPKTGGNTFAGSSFLSTAGERPW